MKDLKKFKPEETTIQVNDYLMLREGFFGKLYKVLEVKDELAQIIRCNRKGDIVGVAYTVSLHGVLMHTDPPLLKYILR